MVREESFDSFYRATRDRCCTRRFALTGDLPAAQSAVRDAYVGGLAALAQGLPARGPAGLGPPARLAARAAPAHRPDLAPQQGPVAEQHKAVLDALAPCRSPSAGCCCSSTSPGSTRRTPPASSGVTRDVAEQNLPRRHRRRSPPRLDVDAGTAQRPRSPRSTRCWSTPSLPRGPIIRRAGRKRRQVARPGRAAVAAAVALGVGRAGLPARAPADAGELRLVKPEARGRRDAARRRGPDRPPTCSTATRSAGSGRTRPWQVTRTDNNTSGDGINTTCQQARFADPRRRTPRSSGPSQAGGGTRRAAVQTVEVSKSVRQAAGGLPHHGRLVRRLPGRPAPGARRLPRRQHRRRGRRADAAALEASRSRTLVGRRRPHRHGHHLDGRQHGRRAPRRRPRQITQSLADSVAMLCARSGSEDCAKQPTYRVVPPPPSGEERGILAVADLPPVGRIARPWVGTEPAPARARTRRATTCDRADFAKAGATTTRTRTYLIPAGVAARPVRAVRDLRPVPHRRPPRAGSWPTYARSVARLRGPRPGHPGQRRAPRRGTGRRSSTCPAGTCRPRSATSRRCASGSASCGSAATVAQLTFAPAPSDDMTATALPRAAGPVPATGCASSAEPPSRVAGVTQHPDARRRGRPRRGEPAA